MHPQRLSSLLVAGVLGSLVQSMANAQVHPERPTYDYEKCYGIARAGQNDCFTPRNTCAGTTTADREPEAWIYLPAGTCARIAGGRLDAGSRS